MEHYSYLVNGEAADAIEKFLTEQHSFQEFCDYIDEFRSVAADILNLDSIVHFDMVRAVAIVTGAGVVTKA